MLGKSKLPLLKVMAPNAICDTINPPDPERALRSHVPLSTSVKGGEQMAAFTARVVKPPFAQDIPPIEFADHGPPRSHFFTAELVA